VSQQTIRNQVFKLEFYTRGNRLRNLLGRIIRKLLPGFNFKLQFAQLFGRAVPVPVMGKTLYVDLKDQFVSSELFTKGIWEPEETAFVNGVLRPGMVVVDVGANIGYYTVLASGIVGSTGRIYAFEPDPSNFKLLRKNVEINQCSNVTIERKAVTNSRQNLLLYRSSENLGDHRIWKDSSSVVKAGKNSVVPIEGTALDEYFGAGSTRVDFLKMDVQGAEYNAFLGMRSVLTGNPAIIVLSEFWPGGLESAGASGKLFLQEARSLGFNIFRLSGQVPVEVSDAELLENLSGTAYASLILSRNHLSEVANRP
jgi:FkbM family methyltransferase